MTDEPLRKPPSPTAHAFIPGPPFDESRIPPARVANVNSTSIPAAVELACRAMGQVFNPEDNGYPYMYTRIWPDGWLGFSPYHGAIQLSGRHLDALLAAEDALGIEIHEQVIAQHTEASFFSLRAGPLPCNHSTPGGPLTSVDEHSIREAVHGLHALARYRASDRAVHAAEALIAEVRRFWSAERDWDQDGLQAAYGLPMAARPTFVEGVGRAIGPLTKLYDATGSDSALGLARDLAAHAANRFFLSDGSYDADRLGAHTHSTTCTLSGMALLGSVTDDLGLLDRVRAFYDNGLGVIRDKVGWVRERHHPNFHPEQGEMNNVGDVIETALILGRYFGDAYFEDAERYLRSQLLPSQVRDLSFMDEAPGGDERRDLRRRLLGLFGFNAVYGHLPLGKNEVTPSIDIVGGATASLCAAQRAVATTSDGVTRINMLFDCESDAVLVESPYTGDALRITPKIDGGIALRVPSWAEVDAITVDGQPARRFVADGRITLRRPRVGDTVVIGLPLAERDLMVHHQDHDIMARLRGDAVVAMDDLGAGLAYFPPVN
ncbi:MAG: hypothetical protein OXO54_12545 [Chloroflexota bacterium]|nr:hypothetical protein [Chloroflexota bacterium]MDE2899140.1 hypothetical protein [Chloroflexota bacterium]